jgi:hypothetical protein
LSIVLTLPFIMMACSDDESPTALDSAQGGPTLAAARAQGREDLRKELTRLLDNVNARLITQRADVRAALVSTIGTPEEQGITVLWRDVGNKHLGLDFVPGDPRRQAGSPEGGWSADPDAISFAIDTGDGATLNGVGSAATTQEIREAMATWDAVSCSNLNLTEVPAGGDLGLFAALLMAGGSFNVVADVQHAGWLELEAGATTIAFTVPFIWVDPVTGVPTDIDNNRELDYAFAEIYYDAFCQGCAVPGPWIWTVDDAVNTPGVLDIDIQSVALHEAGHGLSQGHFGKGFLTNSNGKLHISPNSVMKAAYVDPLQKLHGSDKGGHCSLWGSWPNS